MKTLEYKIYYQRALPHYQPPGATLFITFRLAGSFPQEAIERIKSEKIRLEKQRSFLEGEDVNDWQRRQQKILFSKYDAELDNAKYGPQWLAMPEVANMVRDSLHDQDQKYYILEAYCLMPNHVHMVCTPIGDDIDGFQPISKIMHRLKGSTARKANLILHREGEFWQPESYDHVIRGQDELLRVVNYVLENPVRGGVSTQWTFSRFG